MRGTTMEVINLLIGLSIGLGIGGISLILFATVASVINGFIG
jgi:hypothetical protein